MIIERVVFRKYALYDWIYLDMSEKKVEYAIPLLFLFVDSFDLLVEVVIEFLDNFFFALFEQFCDAWECKLNFFHDLCFFLFAFEFRVSNVKQCVLWFLVLKNV